MKAVVYDHQFYETVRKGARSSADAVVPLVWPMLDRPQTVVDVGCGEGWWGKAFEELGCDVLGIDSGSGAGRVLGHFESRDLSRPFKLPARAELAVCLEVAEHLPARRTRGFVSDLCQIADTVLFSAAIPGQGGHGHINEQWPAYWARLFEGHGYGCSGALRWVIWPDERVENWYRQNLLVMAKEPGRYDELFGPAAVGPVHPISVVHPVLWESRRR